MITTNCEQGWKHQHLVHNGGCSCPMDVGEEQQLGSGAVHLLLFQSREQLCPGAVQGAPGWGWVHRPGWCCPCRLGDSCLPHPAVPSDPQRDNIVTEPRASPCVCNSRNSDQHMMAPRKKEQQCGVTAPLLKIHTPWDLTACPPELTASVSSSPCLWFYH